ncbi:MAG: 16S rRNA (uracil(1498)-N(3))-methyltransferase [Gammaproteobacteria bacterium]
MNATPRIHLPDAAAGCELELPPTVAHHLLHVLRLRSGAALGVFDGAGNEYDGRLASSGRDTARIAVGELIRHEAEPALAITLVPAVARATRMEWMLEKTVELGAAEIRPVLTARGKVRLDAERADRRRGHWQAVLASAAAQCGRARLPLLASAVPFAEAAREIHAESRIVLLPDAERELASFPNPGSSLALFVGPESGFSAEETQTLLAAGWQAARLGPRTLRTETAGPAALAAAQALWGDWRTR